MKVFTILTALVGVGQALPESLSRFSDAKASRLEKRQKSLDPNLKAGVFEQLVGLHVP